MGNLVCSTLSCSSRYALLSLPHTTRSLSLHSHIDRIRQRSHLVALTVRVQPRLLQLSSLWLSSSRELWRRLRVNRVVSGRGLRTLVMMMLPRKYNRRI